MKLRLLTPITRVTVTNDTTAPPRPAAVIAAAVIAAPAMASPAAASELSSPAPQASIMKKRLLAPPLDNAGRVAVTTGFQLAQTVVNTQPVLLAPHVERKDDFRRVYAVAQVETAIPLAFTSLQSHARRLQDKGVRLCLYVAGGSKLRESIAAAGKQKRFTWQVCGKHMFLLYPRGAEMSAEWAMETYTALKASGGIHEAGITIEFPNE